MSSLHAHVVLVVEDNPEAREALAAALETAGMQVVSADGGEMALRRLQEGVQPCAILLDSAMEGMDGSAFRKAQQADERFRDFPVVLLSGRENLREHADRLGIRDALRKPVSIDELRDVIVCDCPRR